MNTVINLRLARKAKARKAAERTAEQNRVLHGLSKADKNRIRSDQQRAASILDGALLDTKNN